MKHDLKNAALLSIGAAMLTACAGLEAPQQVATNPTYEARIDQLANHPCNDRVAGAVQGAGVPANQITELFYTEDLDAINERLVRYIAWMRLAGQPGHLVVDADARTCRATQIYTRDGTRVASVSSF